ncbi:SRPBCC domain-containing protein [Streptomyces sp. NPDC055709]
MNRGTFIDFEGRPAVRFERSCPHPVERVWAAVSEPEGLAHWFPSKVRIEPHEGGKIEFSEDPNLPATTGTVLVFEPPHRLAFTWEGDEIHLEVTARGRGLPAGPHQCPGRAEHRGPQRRGLERVSHRAGPASGGRPVRGPAQ